LNKTGLWTSLTAGDYDNDGDIDYVAGNLGMNSFYRVRDNQPVRIYGKDFDNNGSFDAIPSMYLKDFQKEDQKYLEFPIHGRDDMIKQMLVIRRRFQNYQKYAVANMDSIIPETQRKDAIILEANTLQSSFIRNDGNGHFSLSPLPLQAQLSTLNGMITDDFDGDGNLDIIINTNDYSTDVSIGRYDALKGLMLKGNGNGEFKPLSFVQSGIFIPGNGKALVKIKSSDQDFRIMATQNKGPAMIFKPRKTGPVVSFSNNDLFAVAKLKGGKQQRVENYYGSSFLSQSGRFFNYSDAFISVEITNNKGEKRLIQK
jgi:hypothetical protein